jgi:NAD(P)-dependent dehydrogenase (short-subunit alcohol dehydrogenase family)
MRFAGRSALVTGAAGEIGSAVAGALAREGARLTLLDQDAAALEPVAAATGGLAVPTDVADEGQVSAAVTRAVEHGGGLHLVFNNAGVEGPVAPLEDLDLVAMERVLRINVVGAAAVLKHALPHLGRGGVVVQTGSTASLRGAEHMAPYVASKHALLGLTRTAAKEAAIRGIRVTAVLPGPVDGRMMQRIEGGRDTSGTARPGAAAVLDDGRRARVEEIVSAVLFLLSDEASFVTGHGLVVDGGRLA